MPAGRDACGKLGAVEFIQRHPGQHCRQQRRITISGVMRPRSASTAIRWTEACKSRRLPAHVLTRPGSFVDGAGGGRSHLASRFCLQAFVSAPEWKLNTAPSRIPEGQRVVIVFSRVLKRTPSIP